MLESVLWRAEAERAPKKKLFLHLGAYRIVPLMDMVLCGSC